MKKKLLLLIFCVPFLPSCSLSDGFQPVEAAGVITEFLNGWTGSLAWCIAPDWSTRVNRVHLVGMIEDGDELAREGFVCVLPPECVPYPPGSGPCQADKCTTWSAVEIVKPDGQAEAGVYLIQGIALNHDFSAWTLYVDSVHNEYQPGRELLKKIFFNKNSYALEK